MLVVGILGLKTFILLTVPGTMFTILVGVDASGPPVGTFVVGVLLIVLLGVTLVFGGSVDTLGL